MYLITGDPRLWEELDRLRSELGEVRQENTDLNKQNAKLEKQKAKLEKQNQRLERKNAKLQAENEQLKKENEDRERNSKRQTSRFPRRKRKTKPKKPGRKKGTKATHRKQPAKVDRELDVSVGPCPECWRRVEGIEIHPQLQTDLPGNLVGQTTDNVITLDIDAAGAGWFIDPTPEDHSEFAIDTGTSTLLATGTSDAHGLYDLLTVAGHEVGHLLGFGHSQTGVLDDMLTTGNRRLVTEDVVRPSIPANQPEQPDLPAATLPNHASQSANERLT